MLTKYTKKFRNSLILSITFSIILFIILLILTIMFFLTNKYIYLNYIFIPLLAINFVNIILNIEIILYFKVNKAKIIASATFQILSFTIIGFYTGAIFLKEKNENTLKHR